jgi:hypothetical protein
MLLGPVWFPVSILRAFAKLEDLNLDLTAVGGAEKIVTSLLSAERQ